MTRRPTVARRAEALVGLPVVATSPVAGGTGTTLTKLRFNDGTSGLVKTMPHPPTGFFAAEARGLRALAATPLSVPDLLGADDECLVLRWVEAGRPTGESAEALGRALAGAHAVTRPEFGADQDGFVGPLPLPNRPAPDWAEFYATNRVLPYLRLARDRAAITADEAAAVEAVLPRLPELVPAEPPALLHGDLWNGNVVWGQDGHAWTIDPASYFGHRETDLAMLALFGLPQLDRVLDAYQEASPLADGWRDRIGLHQLFPLLVHAVLFGPAYGARAAAVAARPLG